MSTYSRNEVVSTLTAYYDFLTTLYIPKSAVLYPPEGGWEFITQENYAFLEKTDTVIDLLRHIPYIDQEDTYDRHMFADMCAPLDFRGEYARKHLGFEDNFGPISEEATLGPHAITIGQCVGGRNGTYLILDTERGTITPFAPQWSTKSNELSQIPLNDGRVVVMHSSVPAHGRIKEIFKSYGWPWPIMDKDRDACLKEVKRVWDYAWDNDGNIPPVDEENDWDK
ncbi:hypothetical protein FH972_024619 [Carpinus fangiana]|uniref:Uncharacterized protein n=1 Tax=Carpinus fangiana TaxID=176857 RepID=A0A5N6KYZ7_9ROSI|nr:hypothetical protein FH972_024619 [Carpinus fangiana]